MAARRSARGDEDHFLGMAPEARVVSVKLADASGATDVSQLIAGIDWVVQNKNRNGLNIRVLNLSFGTDAAIVRSTVELTRNLGLRMVAEGVEDTETWQALAAMGCELAQGYHLAPPMPPDQATAWLQQHLEELAASRSDPAHFRAPRHPYPGMADA